MASELLYDLSYCSGEMVFSTTCLCFHIWHLSGTLRVHQGHLNGTLMSFKSEGGHPVTWQWNSGYRRLVVTSSHLLPAWDIQSTSCRPYQYVQDKLSLSKESLAQLPKYSSSDSSFSIAPLESQISIYPKCPTILNKDLEVESALVP